MENLTIGEGPLELTPLVRLIKHSQSFPQLLKEWKNFGRNLGVDETKIVGLERRLGIGTTELHDIPHELLSFWKADKGNSATLKSLFNALVTTQLRDIADLLEQKYWSVIVKSLKIQLHEKEVKLDKLLPANTPAETHRLIYEAFKNHKCIQPIQVFRQDVTPKLATSYYIPRTLSYMTQVDEKIFKSDISNHLFLVKGVTKHELARLSDYKPVDASGNQVDEITVRYMVLEHDDDYDIICRKTIDPVHFIHYENGSYSWVKSSKGLDFIQSFVNEKKETYKEEELIQKFTSFDSTRAVSISDSPGMGKTFLLENLALRLKEADKSIVLFIVLQEFAKQVQFEINSSASALLALSEYVHTSQVAKLILDDILTHLCFDLFLDGYDEVEQSKLIMVDAFVKHVKELKNFRVFVTTRPHLRTQLENTLNLISYEILPFNASNQIEFLTKYWVDKHQTTQVEQVNIYAKKCLKALREQMTDLEMRIAGIPLQCRMVADVYADDAIRVSNLQYAMSAERIKITSLFEVYKKLIDLKFERVPENSIKSNYINAHIHESILLLFPDWIDKLKPLLNGYQEIDENVLYSIGLIEKNSHSNTPRFIHRTFAEYLLAEFLVKNLSKHSACVEILYGVILGGDGVQPTKSVLDGPDSFEMEYPTIGYFLNMHLRYQAELFPIRDMSKYCHQIKLEDLCKAIAACSSHDLEACFDLSVECYSLCKNNNTETSSLVDHYLDMYFKYLPHLTIRGSKRLKLVQKVLEFTKHNFGVDLDYHVYETEKTSYFPWISGCTPLHVAVYYGRYNIVTYLIQQYGDQLKEMKCLLHLCARYSSKEVDSVIEDKLSIIELLVAETKKRDINFLAEWMDDRTPLLEQDVHINLLRRFVELGADINATSKYGTVTHTSGNSENYYGILQWAMSNGFKSVSCFDQDGRTPLLDAIKRNEVIVDVDMLELFHKNGADFKVIDKTEDSALFHALRIGRSDAVISKLIDYGANVNHQNAKKQSAAHVLLDEYPFKDSEEVLKLLNQLISKGFNLLNSPDSEDFVPFSLVLKNVEQLDNPNLFEFFHIHGVDFNASFKCARKKMTNGTNQEKESFGKSTIRSKNRWNTNQRRDDFSKSESKNNFKDLVCWASSNGLNTVNLSEHELWDLFDQAETGSVYKNFNDILDPLQPSSVDANETDSVDNPPLFNIIGRISLASVEKMIECGANVNQENKNNQNLAHAVIVNTAQGQLSKVGSKGAIDALDLLKSKGFTKIDHPDKEGWTPLNFAMLFKEHTNMNMLGFFHENGANFNAADVEGRSVVLLAINLYGDPPLISKCLEYGADLNQLTSGNLNALHFATASRNYANVEFVIDKFDINYVDDFGYTPLHLLFHYAKEDTNILKLLDLFHEKGANFNAVESQRGLNVLFDAIRSNQSPATLKKLIEYGADLYHHNAWKANALHCASRYRNKAALEFLVDKFDINYADDYGSTPLHDLVSDDIDDYCSLDPKLLDLFYEKGANFNAFDNMGCSVLFHAIRSNHNQTVIAKLLQYGANLKYVTSEKETLFHVAALFRNSSALEFLIDKFDIDSVDKYGRTPLHFLFWNDKERDLDLELLDLFHRNGANFNAKHNGGKSILYHAMGKNIRNPVTAVSKLLQCGADLHNITSEKSNALHIAAQNRDYEVLEFLMEKVDLNSVDKGKRTPLHYLVSQKEALDVKLLELFHKKGANFNASDSQRRSILFETIMTNQNASIISKIIEYGGDPYYRNRYGDNYLLIAAWHANSSALEYLLENFNYDFDAVNRYGNTPLHVVFFKEDENYRGVLELLLKKGAKFDIKNEKGYIPLVQWIVKGKNLIPTLLEIQNILPITKEIACDALNALVRQEKLLKEHLTNSSQEKAKPFTKFFTLLVTKGGKLVRSDQSQFNWRKVSKESFASLDQTIRINEQLRLHIERNSNITLTRREPKFSHLINKTNVSIEALLEGFLATEQYDLFLSTLHALELVPEVESVSRCTCN